MRSKQLLITFAAIIYSATTMGQVRIGGNSPITKGAILDLNPTQAGQEFKGGLLLPNVQLKDVGHIPGGSGYFSDFPQGDIDTDFSLEGLIVYNTNEEIGKGIYFWDGNNWHIVGKPGDIYDDGNGDGNGDDNGGSGNDDGKDDDTTECPSVSDGTRTYKTKRYGSQCWMIENLRTEVANDGTTLLYVNTVGTGEGNSNGYKFSRPDKNSSNVSKMGLIYDWKSAKNICPKGWHLPTNEEWITGFANGINDDLTNWRNQGYPGSIYNNIVGNFGSNIYWWASTSTDYNYAYIYSLDKSSSKLSSSTRVYSNFFSVRCVKD